MFDALVAYSLALQNFVSQPLVWQLLTVAAFFIGLILSVAYLTLAERKVIGFMQMRVGPSMAGPMGLLQPIADAVKLLTKELIIPSSAKSFLFLLAPLLTFVLSLTAWAVIPFDVGLSFAHIDVGILFLLSISALNVYAILIAGWSSQSRYAFLGSVRATAQMISYEIIIGFIVLIIVMTSGSLDLEKIVLSQKSLWNVVTHFPMFIIFFACILAETNRAPFDLVEAEAELVAGFHVEYSSMGFALFFLGEYANMILMSALTTILFLGGWLPPLGLDVLVFIPGFIWFALKICFLLFVFIWVRASLPRFRYDQLMRLCWQVFFPLSLVWFLLVALWVRFL